MLTDIDDNQLASCKGQYKFYQISLKQTHQGRVCHILGQSQVFCSLMYVLFIVSFIVWVDIVNLFMYFV